MELKWGVKMNSAEFSNERLEALRRFLYKASLKGYGGEEHRGRLLSEYQKDKNGMIERIYESGVREQSCPDGGMKVIWSAGTFRYSDKWFGGEPFGGMTVVRCDGRACFIMTYYGQVAPEADKELVYACLKEALMRADPELPIRGPKYYLRSGAMERTVDTEYRRTIDGNLAQFSGSEWINALADPHGSVLYEAQFMGGLVNLR